MPVTFVVAGGKTPILMEFTLYMYVIKKIKAHGAI